MSDEVKLLPCPFCGGEAERLDIEDGDNQGGSCITCKRCLASGNVEFGFKEHFIQNWNRRSDPAVLALREALGRISSNQGWIGVPVDTEAAHYLGLQLQEVVFEAQRALTNVPAPTSPTFTLEDVRKLVEAASEFQDSSGSMWESIGMSEFDRLNAAMTAALAPFKNMEGAHD